MKHLILVMLIAPLFAHAENLVLNFKAVPVMDFAEATYKVMLNKDYVIAPDVIGLDKKVTISVKSIDRTKLPQLLSDVLASVEYQPVNLLASFDLKKLPRMTPQSLAQVALVHLTFLVQTSVEATGLESFQNQKISKFTGRNIARLNTFK